MFGLCFVRPTLFHTFHCHSDKGCMFKATALWLFIPCCSLALADIVHHNTINIFINQ